VFPPSIRKLAPAVGISGAPFYSSLYEKYPFVNDEYLLDAYNASTLTKFREVNVGTLDAFTYDYDAEFNEEWLRKQKIPDALAGNILKLGKLYLTWDAITAELISNADGSETIQSHATAHDAVAAQRQAQMQMVGQKTLERLFPDGSPFLSTDQRNRVAGRLLNERRPATMIDTLISALDDVTGRTAASTKVKDALAKQPGYGYTDEAVLRLRSRRAHRSTQYIQYEYGLRIYTDLLSYLQNSVGPTPRVDAYLLQACGLPTPRRTMPPLRT
jgi:hypothetical protein